MLSINGSFLGRVELLKLGDSIDGEEAHVVGVDEADMVEVILLLEDNLVTKGLREPGNICWGGQLIDVAREQDSRDVIILQGHSGCILLSILLHVLDSTVVVESEVASTDSLGVVDEGAPRLSSWERRKAHLEPGDVVNRLIDKKIDEALASAIEQGTESINGARCLSLLGEPVVEFSNVDEGNNNLVDMIGPPDHFRDGDVSSRCDRGQRDEQVHLLLEVVRL